MATACCPKCQAPLEADDAECARCAGAIAAGVPTSTRTVGTRVGVPADRVPASFERRFLGISISTVLAFGIALGIVLGVVALILMFEKRRDRQLVNFTNNTTSYKGQTITFVMLVDELDPLPNHSGKSARFLTYSKDKKRLSLVVDLPPELVLPNVSFPQQVKITFLCQDGSTQSGNVALSVTAE